MAETELAELVGPDDAAWAAEEGLLPGIRYRADSDDDEADPR